jgi:hypothetical protein
MEMIYFDLLECLCDSARDKVRGKPLDGVRTLHVPGTTIYEAGYMHNTRLVKHGENSWGVYLHTNCIAVISREQDGAATVTLDHVTQWPTRLTADRLRGILGIPVWREGGKLRAAISNIRENAKTPPLVNEQILRVTENGVYCVNPEVVRELRKQVLKERAAPVNKYLRELRKIAVALAKVAPPCYAELPHPRWSSLPWTIEAATADIDVVMQLVANGAEDHLGFYGFDRRVKAGGAIDPSECMRFFERAQKKYQDYLYSEIGAYEEYWHSFEKDFVTEGVAEAL